MPTRKAKVVWKGGLKDGKGTMELGSGAFKGNYSFGSRFENEPGTNPEELIGAAHAGCYSMQLSGLLNKDGYHPNSIETNAEVTIDRQGEGFAIKRIVLKTEADVPEIDDDEFRNIAEKAKNTCPVSVALKATEIKLEAKLLSTANR